MKYFSLWVQNNLFLLLLLLLSLLPLFSLLPEGLPFTHDGKDHVARIANFYSSLQEGVLIPRWAENLNWGYGHPVLMFLYPLPSYLASLFHFLGFSFVDSTKLVFAVSYLASGITSFLFFKKLVRKEEAFVGALLYQFAPYRFVDIYVRGAIGEHVAFVFAPLVLFALLKYLKKPSYAAFFGIAISTALLILAHNAISLMTLPFMLGIIGWQYVEKRDLRPALFSFLGIIWGFLLSSFFWIPATIEGKYTLREIVLQDVYLTRFTSLDKFIYSPWGYGNSGEFSVGLGVIHLAVLAGAIYFLIKRREKKIQLILLGLILLLGITVFLMTPESKLLWKYLPLIKSFQFPWRLLTVAVFLLSGIGVVVTSLLSKKTKVYFLWAIGIGCILTSIHQWQAREYLTYPEEYYTSVYHGTTDTGESAPIWSIRFMEKTYSNPLEVITGKATVQEIERTSTRHVYNVNVEEETRFRENTLYFPNWEVYANEKEVPIQFQDPSERGLITFFLPPGEHTVFVLFQNTKVRTFSELLSLFSLLSLGVLYIGRRKLWQHSQ